mmetsp:Transcript_62030/g.183231  ORF Transcript_62030/g.183231 Transcript_62030/m.183231 type:complete len:93 (-) Transcript_62030:254-532(-)
MGRRKPCEKVMGLLMFWGRAKKFGFFQVVKKEKDACYSWVLRSGLHNPCSGTSLGEGIVDLSLVPRLSSEPQEEAGSEFTRTKVIPIPASDF